MMPNTSRKLLVVTILSTLAIIASALVISYEVVTRRADAREQCVRQAAGVEILRLFLTDHQQIREHVPPDPNAPHALPEIERLLDEADCQPE